jgi:uncharacterized membrane protein YfcA
METVIVCIAALLASTLTLFSGFGLGTLLMPVIAIFIPVELAIATTALVHLANNLFKIGLVGRHAEKTVLLKFGLPAIALAFIGAALLTSLNDIKPIYEYEALGREFLISPIKLVIGLIIISMVALESALFSHTTAMDQKWLPIGGAMSGFFGGLSGHQGAFRSMFLINAGLTKEAFVATSVVLAVRVDISRLVIYGGDILKNSSVVEWPLVVSASISAFVGAFIGAKLLKKVRLRSVQLVVSVLLVAVAAGLIFGAL